MNRTLRLTFLIAASFFLQFSIAGWLKAQEPGPATPKPEATKQESADDDDNNPFAPEPVKPLPAGMSGSDASDPRAKLAPGLYDAGEAAVGMRHVALLKKPDAFQLGASDPDDPKVMKTIGMLGIGNIAKMPKEIYLPVAQLAFSNSDMAFQGNHLFQGNFYGMDIYDISDPAKTTLLTTIVCPGGQGDVSVYKNLMFMSVEMPNGRLDCGVEGFPPEPPPPADADKNKDKDKEKKRKIPAAQK